MTDNIIELNVSKDCNQTDDNIVSKADDDILKKWVMIGHHFFKQPNDPSDILITCEAGDIKVCLDEENIKLVQSVKIGRQQDVVLYNHIDRDDAYRIAGMLIAWASTKHLHEKV